MTDGDSLCLEERHPGLESACGYVTMPANLPPDYFVIEKEFRAAKTDEERIALLEEMLSIIPHHKGTDRLRGDLRRKLAKLKAQPAGQKKSSKRDSVFHIDKEGAGQVAVVGLTNVGKSALVAALTNASPAVADYPFTTWIPAPGMAQIEDIQVQMIDTPPLNPEFVEPLLMDLIRRADLVCLVIDLQANPLQQLEDSIALLEAQRIIPLHRQERYTGQRRATFKPFLLVVNKNDDEQSDEDREVLQELLGDEWTLVPVSAKTGRNLEGLKRAVFEALEIIRVYTKPPGKDPDLETPFVLKKGSTVADLAGAIHQDFVENLKAARVWGCEVYDGQMVSRDHVLHDGDVVELRV